MTTMKEVKGKVSRVYIRQTRGSEAAAREESKGGTGSRDSIQTKQRGGEYTDREINK